MVAAAAARAKRRMESQEQDAPAVPDLEGEALLLRYRQFRDAASAEALFKRYADAAFRVARRFSASAADAEDAVQDAFLQVLLHCDRYQPGHSVRAWIMGIVVKTCQFRNRGEAARRRREEAQADTRPSSNAEAGGSSEDRERIFAQVLRLTENHRIAVWLRYVEGLSFPELSQVLDIPERTARTHVSRGLDELRAVLGPAAQSSAALTPLLAGLMTEQAPATLAQALGALPAKAALAAKGGAAIAGGHAAGVSALGGSTVKLAACVVLAVSATAGAVALVNRSPSAPPGDSTKPAVVAEENDTRGDGKSVAPKGDSKAPLGAAEFQPTPERPVGWRGDGSGQFPGATPPVEWGRWLKTPFRDLRSQAHRPKSEAAEGTLLLAPEGHILHEFVIREWLVAGPFAAADYKNAIENEFIAKEGELQPDEGDKAGNRTWKMQPTTGNVVGFDATESNQVYYAHTYLYSSVAAPIGMVFSHNYGAKYWFNGKMIYSHPEDFTMANKGQRQADLSLVKGWNHLMLKVSQADAKRSMNGCWFNLALHPWSESPSYETKNIKWIARMPHNRSISQPIVVGNKLFMTSEPDDLICMNKADGKILWIRTNSYYDALAESDRKALKDKAEPLNARLQQINTEIAKAINAAPSPLEPTTRATFAAKATEREQVSHALYDTLKSADKRFDRNNDDSDFGFSVPTPCSDGQYVYVWFTTGVAACYDLEGNRIWSVIENANWRVEHGNCISPLLVDGKLVVLMLNLMALDAKTGAVAWRHKPAQGFFGSPVCAKVGGKNVIVVPGDGSLLDPATGDALWIPPGNTYFYSEMAWSSSVVANRSIYQIPTFGRWINCVTLPETAGKPLNVQYVKYEDAGDKAEHGTTASPVAVDDLVYSVDVMGLYRVWDPAAKRVVCRQKLNLDIAYSYVNMPGVSASLSVAAKRIYVLDNQGVTIVTEPGRKFTQVRKNVLENICNPRHAGESQEQTLTNPVFDGNCIYIRGMDSLYCIAPTQAQP